MNVFSERASRRVGVMQNPMSGGHLVKIALPTGRQTQYGRNQTINRNYGQVFGRIRQNLLTENKFIKYLPYAIGENVFVMIGILYHYESPLGMSVKKLVMNQ